MQLNDPTDYPIVVGKTDGLILSKFKGRGLFLESNHIIRLFLKPEPKTAKMKLPLHEFLFVKATAPLYISKHFYQDGD